MKGAVLLLDHFRFSTAFHALSKTEQNIHDSIKQRKVLDIYVSNRLSKIHQHSRFLLLFSNSHIFNYFFKAKFAVQTSSTL